MSPLLTTYANGSARGYGAFSVAAAAGDFESIATVTLSSSQSSISFSSIASDFTHLQLRGLLRSDRSGQTQDIWAIRINSDSSTSNYASHRLVGDGASAAAGSQVSGSYAYSWAGYCPGASAASNIFSGVVVDLLDYKDTNKNTTGRILSGNDQNGSGQIMLGSSLYINTPAVTTVTLLPVFGTNFVSGSTIALYGIKSA